MTVVAAPVRAVLLAAIVSSAAAAQDHRHAAVADARLGTIHVATSCRADVAPTFDRAVALLHSFEFGAAIRGFDAVLAADSTCAMAHWGIAVARWGNPMAPGNRAPAQLVAGRAAAEAGRRVASGATERERGYLDAVARLFADHERATQATRLAAYERAMAALAARHADDAEAAIFHALAIVATASPSDKTYAGQKRAGAMLERLWQAQPDHPGIAHYIIHSYDVPALAPLAADAARRYADIAPAAAHALHMPSHTFTRVGAWEASVGTNIRSAAAALRDSSLAEVLHAWDYQVYASLQMRRDSAARAVVAALPALAARFDPTVVAGAAPGSAGVFALAAIPARYALERGAWDEAASLVVAPSDVPYADAMTYFARAVGAARLGRAPAARADADSIAALQARLVARNEAYWAEQVAIQHLGAQAWAELAEGRATDALARMAEAATREDATEKSAVTPGPLAPARELLGDMLLQLDRPADALAEYRSTLTREPNRYRALDGARRAAAAAGDPAAAAEYAAVLARLTAGSSSDAR